MVISVNSVGIGLDGNPKVDYLTRRIDASGNPSPTGHILQAVTMSGGKLISEDTQANRRIQDMEDLIRRTLEQGLAKDPVADARAYFARLSPLESFAGTTAAQSGATLAELQARLGHSTVAAALRYQHAANGRDEEIAEAMSNVVKMKPRTA